MKFRPFLSDDAAAVTVDWVVVSAAVVGLGLGAVVAVRTGVVDLGSDIQDSLAGASVASFGAVDNPLLAGVGTPGCDWYCIYQQFWEWNEGAFDPVEFGHTLDWHADQRIAEFQGYTTQFLTDILADHAGITPQNTPEPQYSTLMAERQIIRNIIAQRGG